MASVAQFEGEAARDGKPGEVVRFRTLPRPKCERSLSLLIESEIIPRLMLAHAVEPTVEDCDGGGVIDAGEPATFALLALEVEADALLGRVEAILARGVGIDSVLVDLLAPAARVLGEYWEADRCDFVEVTMGLWRPQEVVNEIVARTPIRHGATLGGQRALFASMPGDQHNFGTVVIDEVFRRHGWNTLRMTDAATPQLLRRLGGEWFDLVGLTVSCDCHIGPLAPLIVALRNVSRNPRVCVMVGGRMFSADPQLAVKVGADGTAADAKLALAVAADLVRQRTAEAVA